MTTPSPTQPDNRAFDVVLMSGEATVVAEYVPDVRAEQGYQSEADLEAEFIRLLQAQAYEYLPITTEADLVTNLRTQIEALNDVFLTDAEWKRFFTTVIASANDGVVEKTIRIQRDHVEAFRRDDGTTKNLMVLDKRHIHRNRLQVINQYEVPGAATGGQARHANRYDVTVLVNGLPLVHIELKRRGVKLRQAFNQIDRYQRDSFWTGSSLFEYVQLFIISNGTYTKYYSNTTRSQHIKEAHESSSASRTRKSSNSYEFTSSWADARNQPINDLTAFTRTFLAKHTLLNVLTRYCVLTVDNVLMVMRPYQIVATERILQRVVTSTTYKKLGSLEAGGYIWHTTGSGKTLTSFKTAQLATRLDGIDKVLFVVDRKDLDYQTMREYDRFEKGAASSNTSTAVLEKQLSDPNARIVITTIQKLSTFVSRNKHHAIYDQHVVLIFDECHRSQFGDMHTAITTSFTRYNLFGFTGTPIFTANAGTSGTPALRTTAQAFGDKLHSYTIIDAITDRNVLPFRVDYINTIRVGDVHDAEVAGIDTEDALLAPERLRHVTSYILEHFAQKTLRTSGTSYEHSVVTNLDEIAAARRRRHVSELRTTRHVTGFNAIFATASIAAARAYYNQFALQQEQLPAAKRLRIATIFSYGANDPAEQTVGDGGGLLGEEGFDVSALAQSDRDFLDDAINDYNDMFGTSFSTDGDLFENYYKDLSMRLKNREVDLVIVVNMFLTGFDATTLNTLFVDKNLRAHGLIQAYSRTNRILNSVKTYGSIVTFRNLEKATDDALALFGNKDARGTVLLKPYREYLAEYDSQVADLRHNFPLDQEIISEKEEKAFIALFSAVLRLRNILRSFDDFAADDNLAERDLQDYTSVYLELRDRYRAQATTERAGIQEDILFETELIKQVEVNVTYILGLVEQMRTTRGDGEDKEIRATITRAVAASPTLRHKRDLIEEFVATVSLMPGSDIGAQWKNFVADKQRSEIAAIVERENLREPATTAFVEQALDDGELVTTGTGIMTVLPPVSRFSKGADNHSATKRRVVDELTELFDRFLELQ